MINKEIATALDAVYASLHANNEGLDNCIIALKTALQAAGEKTALVEAVKLPHNNRQGRKMMQTYFKKRGVLLEFKQTN